MTSYLDAVNHRNAATAVSAPNTKRKLDDYADDLSSEYLVSCPVRMRKDQPLPSSPADFHLRSASGVSACRSSASSAAACSTSSSPGSAPYAESTRVFGRLQFFVRLLSGGNTLVIHADFDDTVKSIHEKIQVSTGIPVTEQRLIYRGKQLQVEQTLAECDIQNDAGLQLVARMRSTGYPQAWQLINDMVSEIFVLCKTEYPQPTQRIKKILKEFLGNTPQTDVFKASEYLQIFLLSRAPTALVMLYASPVKANRDCASDSIRLFIVSSKNILSKPIYLQFAPIIIEFCMLLNRAAGTKDPVYCLCRSSLGSIVESVGIGCGVGSDKLLVRMQDIFPFVRELASKISEDLGTSMDSSMGPSETDVRDFIAFMLPVKKVIVDGVASDGKITLPLREERISGRGKYSLCYRDEIKLLHSIFLDLLEKMEHCLKKMEVRLESREKGETTAVVPGSCQYLAILKELNSIAERFKGAQKIFWGMMRLRKVSFSYLIVRFAKKSDDHHWILKHKEVTNFEARRHLAMLILPEVKDEYEDLHEMLIDRSQLLSESFEYIAHAEPETLRGGLFMEFKNEEATGPGVLREWFFFVCQAIFNPQNALYMCCTNDRRRFFPNPASKVNQLHLEYFNFSGRVIALALMHKIQIGIVFDRVFFLQLAGKEISLEDIRDADPFLYNSCKQILEMDPEVVDQDVLGLTFIREAEELESREIIELCPNGRSTIVTSKNRKQYVDLLIRHCFVTSIAEQVTHFAQGFTDIIGSSELQKSFFQGLDLEDLDWMLHGSETPISVEDWKANTDYNGFKENDPQISWFWKIVGRMTAEQRKVLLFFWTSIKYLPVEGFGGLSSRLCIYKSTESFDRLPSSHTCFYRLCFPPYPSKDIMKDRLNFITQEHVGSSFGTW
nr:E3 ubiquitin-protein ligase UPL5 [Ipomoea batatas]